MKKVPQALTQLRKITDDIGRAALKAEGLLPNSGLTPTTTTAPSKVLHSTRRTPYDTKKLISEARNRSTQLQQALPSNVRGRITVGVGKGFDETGHVRTIVGSSERNGYLRREVRDALSRGEEPAKVPGIGHAEERILAYMDQQNIEPVAVGAGRPICNQCEPLIGEAGATAATPLKGAPPRGKLD